MSGEDQPDENEVKANDGTGEDTKKDTTIVSNLDGSGDGQEVGKQLSALNIHDSGSVDHEKNDGEEVGPHSENGDKPSEFENGDKPLGDDENLDDDEIEENPAYIPKKGKYYMHDSRDDDELDESDRRKSRADGAWKHDRFDERWQRPKSTKQLLNKYGFNIRGNEQEIGEDLDKEEACSNVPDEDENRNVSKSSQGRPRKPSPKVIPSRAPHIDEREESPQEEKAGDRRQRVPQTKIVRNVRGGRGSSSARGRGDREYQREEHFDRNATNGDGMVRKSNHGNIVERPPQYANHRRGATRGTVAEGPMRANVSRPYTRTFSSTRYDKGGDGTQQDQSFHGRNAAPSNRGAREYRDSRNSRGNQRGSSWRGGSSGYSNGRGGTAPKRYSMQRQEGAPVSSNNRAFVPRQPTDVVYFDPSQQINRMPPPPREKKIIEILPPAGST